MYFMINKPHVLKNDFNILSIYFIKVLQVCVRGEAEYRGIHQWGEGLRHRNGPAAEGGGPGHQAAVRIHTSCLSGSQSSITLSVFT